MEETHPEMVLFYVTCLGKNNLSVCLSVSLSVGLSVCLYHNSGQTGSVVQFLGPDTESEGVPLANSYLLY